MHYIYSSCDEMLTCKVLEEIMEEPFAKAATEKNFQAAASEINIRCKECPSQHSVYGKVHHQEIR